MQVTIKPAAVLGTLRVPASKSLMQRVCAAALLHNGKTIIHNHGTSNDDFVALNIIKQLGTIINHLNASSLQIESIGKIKPTLQIDCGESGLSARLFTPIVALSNQELEIQAHGSLLHRPMDELLSVLKHLGVKILHPEFPIRLQGPLQPSDISINAALSSQYLSGLLFALSAIAKQQVVIKVEDLNSRPYIDLTLSVLRQFGKPIKNYNYESFIIDPSLFSFQHEVVCTIESDWSAASCFMVAAAINGCVTFQNMQATSQQADVALLHALKDANTQVIINTNSITVKHNELKAFKFDATHCPDLFPALCILASAAKGVSHIQGVGRLVHKESNRAASIANMLKAFGIPFYINNDTMCVTGVEVLQATTIDSCNDHRIVMAAAVAALRANGPVTIVNAQAVNKSYPLFFKDLCSLGVECNINNN